MGLITVDRLIVYPEFADIGSQHATALIDDASALVREAAQGELDAVEAPDAPAAVETVIVGMIRRGYENPRGVTQESLGDYSYSMGAAGGGVANIHLTRRERKIVRRAVGVSGVGTTTLASDLPIQPDEPASIDDGITI